MLTTRPAAATASIRPPSTGCGSARRLGGLDDDPGGDREEREAVDEGGEHREAVEAVGAPRVGRAAGDAEGEPGHRERGEVGQHVAGVGDQRERAGEEAAGDLDEHEAAGQERGDADGAGAGGVVVVTWPWPSWSWPWWSWRHRRASACGDEGVEVLRVADGGDLGGLDGDAPAVGDRLVAGQAVGHQRAEAVADEGVGVDRVGREPGLGEVVVPEPGQEVLGVVHRLRARSKRRGQRVEVVLGAAEPDRQRGAGEVGEHRVGRVERVDHLAERAGGVADEVVVAVDLLGLGDEGHGVAGGGDLGAAVLALAAQVLVEGDAALRRVAGLAEVGRERLEVVEGDVGGDVDRVRAQQLAQERVAHRLALEVVDDVLAHVAGADAEIDRVVEPVGLLAQHRGDPGLAEARHAEERDPLVRARAASPRASRRSCAPRRSRA